MKKALIIYLVISMVLFSLTVVLVSYTGPANKPKKEVVSIKRIVVTSTTTPSTIPVPTYVEDADSQKIPNPCETVSVENIERFVTKADVRGPLFQNSIAPTKGCIWVNGDKASKRLGITIILSQTAFDSVESTKTKDINVGENAFLADNFNTGFGGSACGQTLFAKLREFSFSVAYCDGKKQGSFENILIELANDVANSLP